MESKVKDTCLNIQPLLYSYVDNELTPKEFYAVSTHLSECSKCKNAIANIYKIKDMVKVSYAQKEEVDFVEWDSLDKIQNLIDNNLFSPSHTEIFLRQKDTLRKKKLVFGDGGKKQVFEIQQRR